MSTPPVSRRFLLGGWLGTQPEPEPEPPSVARPRRPLPCAPPELVSLRTFIPSRDDAPLPLSAELSVDESPPPWSRTP